MSTVDDAAPRPMRADARRNRERVLKAARETFSLQGRDAQMDDVARRAGVGVGTVYRHFPDKDALLEALVEERFAEFVELGRAALEREQEPWETFSGWLFACGELQAGDRGFCDSMKEGVPEERRLEVVRRTGLLALNQEMIRRGQDAGVIRSDALGDDIALIMMGLAGSSRFEPAEGLGSWRRHLTISLDGLRAPGQSELPR